MCRPSFNPENKHDRMKLPSSTASYPLALLKSPEHLAKWAPHIELAEVLATNDLQFEINYLKTPIDVWAKRKDNPHVRDKLELHHTGTVEWDARKKILQFNNRFSFQKPDKKHSCSNYFVYYQYNSNITTSFGSMESEGNYKLGRLFHGLTSKAYKELADLSNVMVPYIFITTNEAMAFHLACGAILTKFKNTQDILNAITWNPFEESLQNPILTPQIVRSLLDKFKKKIDFDNQAFCRLLPDDVFGRINGYRFIEYLMLLPREARAKLEAELEAALQPPTQP